MHKRVFVAKNRVITSVISLRPLFFWKWSRGQLLSCNSGTDQSEFHQGCNPSPVCPQHLQTFRNYCCCLTVELKLTVAISTAPCWCAKFEPVNLKVICNTLILLYLSKNCQRNFFLILDHVASAIGISVFLDLSVKPCIHIHFGGQTVRGQLCLFGCCLSMASRFIYSKAFMQSGWL